MTKGRCKHCSHQGLKIVCALGLDPEAMAKAACKPGENYKVGLMFRIPCDSKEWDLSFGKRSRHDGSGTGGLSAGQLACIEQKAHCDQFTDPTDEEIAAEEASMKDYMRRFSLMLPLIRRVKQEHKDTNWKGVEVCPACQGKLHMTHASCNGHVWGACETEGCLSWME